MLNKLALSSRLRILRWFFRIMSLFQFQNRRIQTLRTRMEHVRFLTPASHFSGCSFIRNRALHRCFVSFYGSEFRPPPTKTYTTFNQYGPSKILCNIRRLSFLCFLHQFSISFPFLPRFFFPFFFTLTHNPLSLSRMCVIEQWLVENSFYQLNNSFRSVGILSVRGMDVEMACKGKKSLRST